MPARSSAETSTKRSFPPPSRTMKPNPLAALYHFTSPSLGRSPPMAVGLMAILNSFVAVWAGLRRCYPAASRTSLPTPARSGPAVGSTKRSTSATSMPRSGRMPRRRTWLMSPCFADVFVLARFQPIAPDHLHRAPLAAICFEPKKQARRVIVAVSRALVERAADGQFDPPPREHRVSGKVDIDMPKEHRRAVMGFKPHARHAVLDHECHRHRKTCPEFPMLPPGRGADRAGRVAQSPLRPRPARHRVLKPLLARRKSATQSRRRWRRSLCLRIGSIALGRSSLPYLPLWNPPLYRPLTMGALRAPVKRGMLGSVEPLGGTQYLRRSARTAPRRC
jgi:hypothetical protein